MKVRFNLDRESGSPHIWDNGVAEAEVVEVLNNAIERRSGSHGSDVLIGRTNSGRILRDIVSFDVDGEGVFVITAYELQGKPLKALRRRMRRKGSR